MDTFSGLNQKPIFYGFVHWVNVLASGRFEHSMESHAGCFSRSLTFESTAPDKIGTAVPAREVGAAPENAQPNQRWFTQRMMFNRWAMGRVRAAISSDEAKIKDGRAIFGNEPLCEAQTSPSLPQAACHSEVCRKMK
jgi:hypothetical protein